LQRNLSDQSEASPIVHEVQRSSAQPLNTETHSFMEPRFGHRFDQVRVFPAPVETAQNQPNRTHPGGKYEQEADRIASEVLDGDGVPSIAPFEGRGYYSGPRAVDKVLRSGEGVPLASGLREFMEARFGTQLGSVRVYAGAQAAEATQSVGAGAFTIGEDIVFATGQFRPDKISGRHLLAHELTHVLQQRSAPMLASGPPTALMQTPFEKVGKFALRYLSKRTIKTVSKHVAKHARRILTKPIHTVFRHPKKIKQLLEGTLQEAIALAAKHRSAPGTKVIEEAGLRIAQQTTRTPGKVRWVVLKEFKEAIGTKGERVLRIVIDQSGRIVTAFPQERFAAIGLTAGGLALLEERTASAAEQVQAQSEASAKAEAEKESSLDWEDFIPFIGDIWGGSLNEGEDEMLRQQRWYKQIIDDIIAEVEFEEKRSLSKDERDELENLVRVGIAAPHVAEDDNQESSSGDASPSAPL
jgi:hypothetical protein